MPQQHLTNQQIFHAKPVQRPDYYIRYLVQERRTANPNSTFAPPSVFDDIINAHKYAMQLVRSSGMDVRVQEQIVHLPVPGNDTYRFGKPRTVARAYQSKERSKSVVLTCDCDFCGREALAWGMHTRQSYHNMLGEVFNQATRLEESREHFETKYYGHLPKAK